MHRKPIAVNARFCVHQVTGMQRYAWELASRFSDFTDSVRPEIPLTGMIGHLWEQTCLPALVRGRLLWSPNNTGPIATQRQVCTIHDLAPLDNPELFSPRFSAWYGWLMPRLARRVAHLIAVSHFTCTRIVARLEVPPEKITVIPHGIAREFCPRPSEEIRALRKSLKLPSGPYFLFVSALVPRKNVDRLLLAWERVYRDLPDETFLVIAGGQGSSQVSPQIRIDRERPRVHFTGYVGDECLPALYSGALAFVYPSLYEGFGFPALEAMACGTPVITSNTTSLPEVTADAAIHVDPLAVDQLAAAIMRLSVDSALRTDLSKRGAARAATYSWEKAADETLKVLKMYMYSTPPDCWNQFFVRSAFNKSLAETQECRYYRQVKRDRS
jgi:glycosyltransferase involved in cell wall biosynthesis